MNRFPTRLAAIAAALLMLVSCGIPLDDSPRAAGGQLASQDADNEQAGGNTQAWVYFIHDGRVAPTPHDVEERTPLTVLRAATMPPTATEASRGFVSQIPKGTEVLAAEQTGDMLDVSLSSEFDNVIGSSRQQAIAQFVYTATELVGVNQLAFTISGVPVQVSSTYRGDVREVTACDFYSLLPASDEQPGGLTPDEARHIEARRRALQARCPAQATTG